MYGTESCGSDRNPRSCPFGSELSSDGRSSGADCCAPCDGSMKCPLPGPECQQAFSNPSHSPSGAANTIRCTICRGNRQHHTALPILPEPLHSSLSLLHDENAWLMASCGPRGCSHLITCPAGGTNMLGIGRNVCHGACGSNACCSYPTRPTAKAAAGPTGGARPCHEYIGSRFQDHFGIHCTDHIAIAGCETSCPAERRSRGDAPLSVETFAQAGRTTLNDKATSSGLRGSQRVTSRIRLRPFRVLRSALAHCSPAHRHFLPSPGAALPALLDCPFYQTKHAST